MSQNKKTTKETILNDAKLIVETQVNEPANVVSMDSLMNESKEVENVINQLSTENESLKAERQKIGESFPALTFDSDAWKKALTDLQSIDAKLKANELKEKGNVINRESISQRLKMVELLDNVKEGNNDAYNECLTLLCGGSKKVSKLGGAKVAGEGTKSAQIIAIYLNDLANGLTETESRKGMIAAGFNDGTVGNAIVTYRNANGLTK